MGALQKGALPRELDRFRSSSHALFEMGIKQRQKPDMLAPFDNYPLDQDMMTRLKAVCPAETPQAHLDVFLRSRDDWQKMNLERALGRLSDIEAQAPIQQGPRSSAVPGGAGARGSTVLAAETTACQGGLRGLSFPALQKHFEKSRWRSTHNETFNEEAVRRQRHAGLEVPVMASRQPNTFRVHLRSVEQHGPRTVTGASFFGKPVVKKKKPEEEPEIRKRPEAEESNQAGSVVAAASKEASAAASSVRPELRQSLDRWKDEDPDTFKFWNDSARSLNWVAHQYAGPKTTYSEYGHWGYGYSPGKQRKLRPFDSLGAPHEAGTPRKQTARERWMEQLKQDPARLKEMQQRIPNVPNWTGPAEDGVSYQLTLKPNKTREPFTNSQVSVKASLVHGMVPKIQTQNQDVHSDGVQQPSRRAANNPVPKVSGCAFVKGNRRMQFPCVAIAVCDGAQKQVPSG